MLGTYPLEESVSPERRANTPVKDVVKQLNGLKERLLPEEAFQILTEGDATQILGSPKRWWVISPMADIWLVPFAALPIHDDDEPPQTPTKEPGTNDSSTGEKVFKYAIEKFRISYQITGRDLVNPRYHSRLVNRGERSVVVAQPAYNQRLPDRVTAHTRDPLELVSTDSSDETISNLESFDFAFVSCGGHRLFHRRGWQSSAQCVPTIPPVSITPPPAKAHLLGEELVNTLRTSKSGDTLSATLFSRFPSTPYMLDLGKRVSERLNNPREWFQGLATEENMKSLNGPPQVFICTHGFAPGRPNKGFIADKLFAKPDPMMRCGIALAGVNRRPGIVPESERERGRFEIIEANRNEGILLGREVVQECNLDGTEVVVLICCVTGVGEPIRSQGAIAGDSLASSRHAFTMAGAQAVVASSWEVSLLTQEGADPKKPTKDFTTMLITSFLEKMNALRTVKSTGRLNVEEIEEALRGAQLKLLATVPERHPYYWAPFSVTGP